MLIHLSNHLSNFIYNEKGCFGVEQLPDNKGEQDKYVFNYFFRTQSLMLGKSTLIHTAIPINVAI